LIHELGAGLSAPTGGHLCSVGHKRNFYVISFFRKTRFESNEWSRAWLRQRWQATKEQSQIENKR